MGRLYYPTLLLTYSAVRRESKIRARHLGGLLAVKSSRLLHDKQPRNRIDLIHRQRLIEGFRRAVRSAELGSTHAGLRGVLLPGVDCGGGGRQVGLIAGNPTFLPPESAN